MRRLFYLFVLIAGMGLVSCEKGQVLIIASELRINPYLSDYESFPQYVYKTTDESQWDYLIDYQNFHGFDYEPGYEYVVEAEYFRGKEPEQGIEMDASGDYYLLTRIISKEKRDSQNLPGEPVERW